MEGPKQLLLKQMNETGRMNETMNETGRVL